MRRLLVAVLILVGLLVIADRVSAHLAARAVAQRVETSEGLPARPDVSFGGFPFLTQALGGSYDDIRVTSHHLTRRRVPVSELIVHLHGAHVPFGAALRGDVRSIPVDREDATALFAFSDLNATLASRGVHVDMASRDQVRITGTVRGVAASALGTVSVSGDTVVITVQQVTANIGGVPVSASAAFSFTVDASRLPFGLHVTGVSVDSTGLVVTAVAHDIVIQRS